MLVTCIIDQALKESLNYFVVATKSYQLKQSMKRSPKNKPVVVSAGYSEIVPTPGSSRKKNESKAFSSNVLSFSQIEAAEMDKK